MKCLTIFVDGCTDFLFEKAVPDPHYIFRLTNIQSADGAMAAIAAASAWPEVRKIAHIHPDYSYGRNAFDHFNVVMKKLTPGKLEVVSEAGRSSGPRSSPPTSRRRSRRSRISSSARCGGDYVALYKQALRYDLFKKMKVATTLASASPRTRSAPTIREGIVAGVHSNYHFMHPPGNRWPLNAQFVKKFHDRWKEYPNFQAEGSYTTLYMLKLAIEKANRLMGGWPDEDAIIAMLEGLSYDSPAGYVHIRADNHQGYKDGITGFSVQTKDYPFPVLDQKRVITVPIRSITAPPGYPKGEPTTTYKWIEETWPQASA